MKGILSALTFLGGIVAMIQVFYAIIGSASAPQQGALAALAVSYVVIPYCMGRALEMADNSEKTYSQSLAAAIKQVREEERQHETDQERKRQMDAVREENLRLEAPQPGVQTQKSAPPREPPHPMGRNFLTRNRPLPSAGGENV